jgi:hypothetical protein
MLLGPLPLCHLLFQNTLTWEGFFFKLFIQTPGYLLQIGKGFEDGGEGYGVVKRSWR